MDNRPNILGQVTIINSISNKQEVVHKRRILPVDCVNKVIIITVSGKYTITCPISNCILEPLISNGSGVCPDHGTFDVYLHDSAQLPTSQSSVERVSIKREIQMQGVNVDLEALKQYGEIYVKKVAFNHSAYDVKTYLIVAHDPPRKICFNLYNGALGKKSKDPVAELGLEAFKANDTSDSKHKVYVFKSEEELNKELAKGYEKQ